MQKKDQYNKDVRANALNDDIYIYYTVQKLRTNVPRHWAGRGRRKYGEGEKEAGIVKPGDHDINGDPKEYNSPVACIATF